MYNANLDKKTTLNPQGYRYMQQRRKTRQVIVGDDRVGRVAIGGDAPVVVQTMTEGYTHDVDACVAEINKLAAAGASHTDPNYRPNTCTN